ncbi:Calcineurin-like phosphoesterase superfamily domain [Gaiella occulta]|uniref:Calcineurin-like phosphoesterase superfamily domain n=1 Tax=Gaiella occulta TaxID=1002870 RepID=A0A7M2YVF1_9ACTN|nr:metallophosphoesterase [Gaiella occulta]RDI73447.1 Calcineurin-like phosphoesterase superfamily domain [Gaiella occulta]
MTGCAIHFSDLHRGVRETSALDDALVALCHDLAPVLAIASGDLSNRGRVQELRRAKALLDRLPAPVLAVPGNHDIPYTLPGRVTRPWRAFEEVFGSVQPVVTAPGIVACGLNSVRPWRHQGGRLPGDGPGRAAEAFAAADAGALRVVVLHHHLAGAPWRAARKLPLKRRDAALSALAASGAELIVGGHIHQSSVVERHEFEAVDAPRGRSVVLATAPGLGRPRPRRTGEAQGLHVVRWTARELAVETHVWDGGAFVRTATRTFPRG